MTREFRYQNWIGSRRPKMAIVKWVGCLGPKRKAPTAVGKEPKSAEKRLKSRQEVLEKPSTNLKWCELRQIFSLIHLARVRKEPRCLLCASHKRDVMYPINMPPGARGEKRAF